MTTLTTVDQAELNADLGESLGTIATALLSQEYEIVRGEAAQLYALSHVLLRATYDTHEPTRACYEQLVAQYLEGDYDAELIVNSIQSKPGAMLEFQVLGCYGERETADALSVQAGTIHLLNKALAKAATNHPRDAIPALEEALKILRES